MNSFKRGEEPLRALDIGTISNAPYIRSLATIEEYMDIMGYIRTSFKYILLQDYVQHLRKIESGELSVEGLFISVIEKDWSENRLFPLAEYKGKYLRYAHYSRDKQFGFGDDDIGPQEFSFKIPK